MAHQSTIRQIVRAFDRIDAYLDNMSEEDAKVVLVRMNKVIRKFDIPANKNSSEKVRSSGPPSTKQVAGRKKPSDATPNRKPKQESKGMAKELSKAEIKAYKDEHGIKRLSGDLAEQSAKIADHQKHFKALVKKGSDALIKLVQKNVDEDFKLDGRIRKEEVRAAKAADAILAAGYVPAGKGIAKPESDEKPAKKASSKTNAKAEKVTSKKESAKATKKRPSRDEDDEDEDEAPKRKSKKTVVAEKPAKKAKKVVEKASVKKTRRSRDDEDEAPKKKVKKTSSKDEKSTKLKKKHKKSRD